MPYFKSGDITLHYQSWGQGPSVVFVHGWAIGGACWEYQALSLSSQGLRCIVYDQRGCGRSEDPGHGFDYDALADDLAALLLHIDVRDAVLVGHSMGCGVIAQYLWRHSADRVGRIVLIATTTPFLLATADNAGGVPAEVVGHQISLLVEDRPRYVAALAPGFFGEGQPGCSVSPDLVRWGIDVTLQASPIASVEMLRTNTTTDQRAQVAAITVPTLVLHGTGDQSAQFDLTGRRTADLVRGSRLIAYADAPHGLIFTHASRIVGDIVAFIP